MTRPSIIGALAGQTASTTVTVTRPAAPEGSLIAVFLDAIIATPGELEEITPPAGFIVDVVGQSDGNMQIDAFFKVAGAVEPPTYDFEYSANSGGVRWNVTTLNADQSTELAAGGGNGFAFVYTVNGVTAEAQSLQLIFVSASSAETPAGATEAVNEDGDTFTFTRPLDASTDDENYSQDGGSWGVLTFVYGPLPETDNGGLLLA